jgi:hypothetical protein
MFSSPGFCCAWAGDKYASDAPMFTVPAAADEMPVPEPVAAVVIDTLGHSFWICAVQRLNKGYSKVDPVSCSATALVGQFSRLCSEAAAVVVDVEEGGEALGVELHAARTTAEAATIDSMATPPNRPVPRFRTPRDGAVEGRVDMTGEAPFDWNYRGSETGTRGADGAPCAGSGPSAGGHPILPLT